MTRMDVKFCTAHSKIHPDRQYGIMDITYIGIALQFIVLQDGFEVVFC